MRSGPWFTASLLALSAFTFGSGASALEPLDNSCFQETTATGPIAETRIPANTPALFFTLRPTRGAQPGVGLLDEGGSEVPIDVVPYVSGAVGGNDRDGFLARPRQPLLEDRTYTLYAGPGEACTRDELAFRTGPSAPLPTTSGTLGTTGPYQDNEEGFVYARLHAEVRRHDWSFGATSTFTVEVDGRRLPHSDRGLGRYTSPTQLNPDGGGGAIIDSGDVIVRHTLTNITVSCKGPPPTDKPWVLTEGTHQVKVQMIIAGAAVQPEPSTREVNVRCADAPPRPAGATSVSDGSRESSCTVAPATTAMSGAVVWFTLGGLLLLRRRRRS